MIGAHLQTIFSFRSYHRLALATRLQCLGFVVYLCILSLLVFYAFSSSYIRRNLPLLLKNFPQVTFDKGVLQDPQQTVYVSLPDSPLKIEFDAKRQTPPANQELIEKHILALVSGNTVYMPGSTGVQSRTLPPTLSVTTTQDFLNAHRELIAGGLGLAALAASLFLIPMVLFFSFCTAAVVGISFNFITNRHVPYPILLRWALFLLGPLSMLWYIKLWYPIPLFTLAQFILCIIYIQQIFNLLPEEK